MSYSPKRKTAGVEDGQSCSRSGRVRKPKVFYDPSESDAKRRSLPNMETTKSKKVAKVIESEPKIVEPIKPDKTAEKTPPKPKRENSAPAGTISARRRTICVPIYDDETGCIVCGRIDTRKGRFVNCIDCIKRGHFTCLRNDKLFRTADRELNWQCPACKICEYCQDAKSKEELLKCTICLNSYHLNCSNKIAPLPKNVVKKKFACGECTKRPTAVKHTEPTKSLLVNRKSDGFPGFAHEETAKVVQKPIANATLNTNANSTAKKQFTSLKTMNSVIATTLLRIKQEKPSPTPEQNQESFERRLKLDGISVKKISVRKDLVQPDTPMDESKPESDNEKMEIEYDTKTAITPHDSIPDVRKWDCDEVYMYFTVKTPEYAQLFKDNQIDGDALLLIKREDVLNRFNLKLGPALRLYSHIVSLQYKNNNPILAWNEF